MYRVLVQRSVDERRVFILGGDIVYHQRTGTVSWYGDRLSVNKAGVIHAPGAQQQAVQTLFQLYHIRKEALAHSLIAGGENKALKHVFISIHQLHHALLIGGCSAVKAYAYPVDVGTKARCGFTERDGLDLIARILAVLIVYLDVAESAPDTVGKAVEDVGSAKSRVLIRQHQCAAVLQRLKRYGKREGAVFCHGDGFPVERDRHILTRSALKAPRRSVDRTVGIEKISRRVRREGRVYIADGRAVIFLRVVQRRQPRKLQRRVVRDLSCLLQRVFQCRFYSSLRSGAGYGSLSVFLAAQQQLPLRHSHSGLQPCIDVGIQCRCRTRLGLPQRRVRRRIRNHSRGHVKRLIAIIGHGAFAFQIGGAAGAERQRFCSTVHSGEGCRCNNHPAAAGLPDSSALYRQLK